jgi:hypothetical protein
MEDDISLLGVWVMSLLLVALIAFAATHYVLDNHWKAEAVKHGAAEWVSGEDGTAEWRWKVAEKIND